jgi:hypothetical protein
LNPWKPGESGNPSGRPKGTGIYRFICQYHDMTRKELAKIKEDKSSTMAMVNAASMVLAGEYKHDIVKDQVDREEGKAIQTTNINANTQGVQVIEGEATASQLATIQAIQDTISDSNEATKQLLNNINNDILEDNSEGVEG